jgi:hypothetical protein
MNSGELSNNLLYIFSRAVDLDRPAILRWESWLAAAIMMLAVLVGAAALLAARMIFDALRSSEVTK